MLILILQTATKVTVTGPIRFTSITTGGKSVTGIRAKIVNIETVNLFHVIIQVILCFYFLTMKILTEIPASG